MKLLIGIALVFVATSTAFSQSYRTVDGVASFYSSAPLEDIRAENKAGTGLFNGNTGALAFRIPIKGFVFRKALMQQHFNENYMESDKYPDATFEGKLSGYDLTRRGKQEVEAEGRMSIHGVDQRVKVSGTLTVTEKGLSMDAIFPISLSDYDIEIPKVVVFNIAEEVEVTVSYRFSELN